MIEKLRVKRNELLQKANITSNEKLKAKYKNEAKKITEEINKIHESKSGKKRFKNKF